MSTLDETTGPVATSPPRSGRASAAEAAEFAEHLAGLARSGLPLPSGLRALGAELPSRRVGRALIETADRLERGEAIDAAIVGLAGRFPPGLRGLLVAGARSGTLADVLGRYVAYANLGAALRRQFRAAVAYPLFLLTALAGLYVFVCLWVVEAFRFILKDFGMEHPPITQALFWMSEATRTRGPSIAATAAAIGLVVAVAFRFTMGPAERRMVLTGVPLVGPVLRWSALAEFCHLAALLVEAEVPLPEALGLAGGAVGDAELARAGAGMRASVEAGNSLATALGAWPRCPAGLHEVLGDSEGRGDLGPSLHLAGEMCEARARSQTSCATALIAAATVLLLLWGIGFVLGGLYLPLYLLLQRLA